MSADRTTDRVVSRYSKLARGILAGDAVSGGKAEAQEGRAAYADETGAPEGALRASLGCGNPLMVADLRPGETVLDLGSGGGLDVLLSARRVGPEGIAYGLDASADMLALARANAAEAGVATARFLHGYIESVPLPDDQVDVVISNCVINLSADKASVLAEAFRVLRPGGRLGITDIIADDGGDRIATDDQADCLAGALTELEYHELLSAAGFTSIRIIVTRSAGDGLNSAIVQAVKPVVRQQP